LLVPVTVTYYPILSSACYGGDNKQITHLITMQL